MRIVHVARPAGCAPALPWFIPGHASTSRGLGRDLAVISCGATMRASPGHEHAALIVADSRGDRRCRTLGLEARASFSAPLGVASFTTRSLRDAMWRMGTVELVIAWGRELEDIVARAAPPKSARATVDLARGVIDVVMPDRFGFSVGAATLNARCDPMRTAGAKAEPGQILLLSDPPERADVAAFAVVLGLLSVGGVESHGVAPRQGHGVERALRHLHEGGVLRELRLTNRPTLCLIPQSAAVVVGLSRAISPKDDAAGDAPPAPDFSDAVLAHMALDHGVPVVAPQGPALAAIARDRGGMILVDLPTPVGIARGLERAMRELSPGAGREANRLTDQPTLAEGVARIIEQVGRRLAPPPPTFVSSAPEMEATA